MSSLFFKGLLIGLAIAAPVGPIGVLCIQNTLHHGFRIGLITGMGAALADGIYGLIVGLGLTALSSFLINYQFWIRILGGLFLIFLGIRILMTPPFKSALNPVTKSAWNAFGVTFLLTLTNPMTILSFAAILGGLGITKPSSGNYLGSLTLISGILLGSAAWWLLLSSSIAFFLHHRLKPATLKIINWLSGGMILFFGVLALYTSPLEV